MATDTLTPEQQLKRLVEETQSQLYDVVKNNGRAGELKILQDRLSIIEQDVKSKARNSATLLEATKDINEIHQKLDAIRHRQSEKTQTSPTSPQLEQPSPDLNLTARARAERAAREREVSEQFKIVQKKNKDLEIEKLAAELAATKKPSPLLEPPISPSPINGTPTSFVQSPARSFQPSPPTGSIAQPIAIPTPSISGLRQASSQLHSATNLRSTANKITSQIGQTATHTPAGATKETAKNAFKKGLGSLTEKGLLKLGFSGAAAATGVGAVVTAWNIGGFLWKQRKLLAGLLATALSISLIFLSGLFAAIGSALVGTLAGAALGYAALGPLGIIPGAYLGYNFQTWLGQQLGIGPGQNAALAHEMATRATSGTPTVRPNPLTGRPELVRSGGLYDGLSAAGEAAANMVTVPLFTTLGIAFFGTFFVTMHILTAFTVPNPVGTIPVNAGPFPSGVPPSGYPLPSGTPAPLPPPVKCFQLDNGLDQWTSQKIIEAHNAITDMQSSQPGYVTKLCNAAGRILLQYGDGRESYCGYNQAAGLIILYDCGANGVTTYTLAHETGHSFAKLHPEVYQDFFFQGFGQSGNENFLHTYPLEKTTWEDFAETVGVFIGIPNILDNYPLHRAFAQANIFN